MNVRRFVVPCVAVASAAAVFACSLFVDTSGFDGPSPAADAGMSDAESGAPTFDAADASSDSSSPSSPSCDATFCDDFDTDDLASKWTNVMVAPGTSLARDSTLFHSSPRSLFVTIPEKTDESSPAVGAYVERVFDDNPLSIRCELRIRVERGPDTHFKDIFIISSSGDPGIAHYNLIYSVKPNGTYLRDDFNLVDGGCDCPRDDFDLPPLQDGEWNKVAIATDFTSTTTLHVNDVLVFSGNAGMFKPRTLSIRVGAETYRIDPSFKVRFDDVVCTVER